MSARPWPVVAEGGEKVDPPWRLEREGRSWRDEAMSRYSLTPEKIEMVRGKLLDRDEDRELLLGLLLENVGADRAVQFGEPKVWRAAIAALKRDATE